MWSRRRVLGAGGLLAAAAVVGGWRSPSGALAGGVGGTGCGRDMFVPSYNDGRPVATLRMDAVDAGRVLRHGDGPNMCDVYGARDVWVHEYDGTYYMHYDAAGPPGWLLALATSRDGVTWEKHGTVLDLGPPGSDDSATASYGVTYQEGEVWHLFYVGSPNATPPPDRVPSFPYYTMKATGPSPWGPWTKHYDVVPFRPTPGAYYSATASPGHVVRHGDEYLQFPSVSTQNLMITKRSVGIARTKDLNGPWTLDDAPIVPLDEQIENSSLYYEEATATWFLFTNHIADLDGEYTDAIWVYWTQDLNSWDMDDKAVVLDRNNCSWSQRVIGLPSVLRVGDRLAIYYDGVEGTSTSHMRRDVGLAWLDLPLQVPERAQQPNLALSAVASASTTEAGYDVAKVNDGSPNTGVGPEHGWASVVPLGVDVLDLDWVQLDLGEPREVARVDLYFPSRSEQRDYKLQAWNGSRWQDLVTPVTGNTTVYRRHHFMPLTTSKLRVVSHYGTVRLPSRMHINEIEVYASHGAGLEC